MIELFECVFSIILTFHYFNENVIKDINGLKLNSKKQPRRKQQNRENTDTL